MVHGAPAPRRPRATLFKLPNPSRTWARVRCTAETGAGGRIAAPRLLSRPQSQPGATPHHQFHSGLHRRGRNPSHRLSEPRRPVPLPFPHGPLPRAASQLHQRRLWPAQLAATLELAERRLMRLLQLQLRFLRGQLESPLLLHLRSSGFPREVRGELQPRAPGSRSSDPSHHEHFGPQNRTRCLRHPFHPPGEPWIPWADHAQPLEPSRAQSRFRDLGTEPTLPHPQLQSS